MFKTATQQKNYQDFVKYTNQFKIKVIEFNRYQTTTEITFSYNTDPRTISLILTNYLSSWYGHHGIGGDYTRWFSYQKNRVMMLVRLRQRFFAVKFSTNYKGLIIDPFLLNTIKRLRDV
jgi:hypothetical protein